MHYNIFTVGFSSTKVTVWEYSHAALLHLFEIKNSILEEILIRNADGNIVVQDKPAYFKCASIEAIQDAFSIQGFAADKPTVYLEGRTDEKYFKKVLEVFSYDVPFQFKWVGYMKDAKNEENTGKDALNKAVQFLIGRNLPIKNVCLFDCDTSRSEAVFNNVYTRVIPTYENSKRMKKGIENALVLDSVDVTPYYSSKVKEGDYGDDNTIVATIIAKVYN